jgi:DNA topoisomerase-1
VGLDDLLALYSEPQRCAEVAGLRYVDTAEPGLTRRRCGRGFRYLDSDRRNVDAATRERIIAMAIPPAWRDVWICADANGHLLATGVDDRDRRQYLYHERWREVRDLLNFYRVVDTGRWLPDVRAYVDAQLRRRTLDADRVLAAMLRIVDACGIRIGNEVYAEENDSIGLCTLSKKHVSVTGSGVVFRFPAKSGRRAELRLADRRVARVVTELGARPGRRLFTIDGSPVVADDVNGLLGRLSDGSLTAKDFRTWRGTLVAFALLRANPDVADRERRALDAIDAAADVLGNTRAVARAHYVHPHLIETFVDGSFGERLAASKPVRRAGLSADEQAMLGYLEALLAADSRSPGSTSSR